MVNASYQALTILKGRKSAAELVSKFNCNCLGNYGCLTVPGTEFGWSAGCTGTMYCCGWVGVSEVGLEFDCGLPSGTGCRIVVVRVPSLTFDGS